MYLIMTDKMAEFGRPEIVNVSRTIFIMNVLNLNDSFIKANIYTHICMFVCIDFERRPRYKGSSQGAPSQQHQCNDTNIFMYWARDEDIT